MVFLIFVLVYILAQFFIAWVLITGFMLAVPAASAVVCTIMLLAVLPFVARRLDRRRLFKVAAVVAWIGYTWAGLVLLFVLARLIVLVIMGIVQAAHLSTQYLIFNSAYFPVTLTLILTALIALYAFWERSRIRLEYINIPTEKLPVGCAPIRIAQISDVHIGLINGLRRMRTVTHKLAHAKADMIVSTGDFLDSAAGLEVPVSSLFAALNPPLGKFAVVGNHEFYAGLKPALVFLEKGGFEVLRNRTVSLPDLTIVGIDDPATDRQVNWVDRETQILEALVPGRFTIFLKHRPDVVASSAAHFDLQLSGHTHKGQIFPFGLLTRLYYPAHAGLFRLSYSAYLYVSRGTGAWGPPFRLFAPPEITLFEIGPGRLTPRAQDIDGAYAHKR